MADQYQFFHFHLAFPEVFAQGGFDVALGNPPWERVTLKEKEWFAERRVEIANAPHSAARKRLIEALRSDAPALYTQFQDALRQAEGEAQLIRNGNLYPLCGRGDINLYAIFTEGMRNQLAPQGRAGCLVPSGIATDDNTKFFFRDLMQSNSLVSLFDFENRKNLFEGVGHGRSKFCLLSLSRQSAQPSKEASFVFFAHDVDDLRNEAKRFTLSAEDIALLNPNSGTCPVFQFRRDAELTKAVYRSVPVLIKEQPSLQNPWGVSFLRMIDMASDSHLFQTTLQLQEDGWLEGVRSFTKDTQVRVPLYEAKMCQPFNHRGGDYRDYPEGSLSTHLPEVPSSRFSDPNYWTLPRYWISASAVEEALIERWNHQWMLGWRNVTHATNDRTLIANLIPLAGVAHSMAVILPTAANPAQIACLYANLTSFAQDYLVRQKIGGINLTYGYISQVPIFPPSAYDSKCRWSEPLQTLSNWLLPRVLELTYTAWDLEAFAQDCGWSGPPFRWDEERRFLLRCEMDAAFFHLYLGPETEWRQQPAALTQSFPTPRDAVSYIMDTFPIVKRKDEAKFNGDYLTKRTILAIYDALAEAMKTGQPYQTRLNPPPADPRYCHPPRDRHVLQSA